MTGDPELHYITLHRNYLKSPMVGLISLLAVQMEIAQEEINVRLGWGGCRWKCLHPGRSDGPSGYIGRKMGVHLRSSCGFSAVNSHLVTK